jgi:hypothetical protein
MLCCLPPIANIMTATGTTHSDGQKDMHQLWQEKEIKPPPNDEQMARHHSSFHKGRNIAIGKRTCRL